MLWCWRIFSYHWFFLFMKLLRRIHLFTSSNWEPTSLCPNFFQPEPQQPDALGGHRDPLSPKHNHSNPRWGCLEVNIHSTLIRNIWPPKRVDTAQAGSGGFVVGTQSYRGWIKNTIGKHQPGQGILQVLHCGTWKFHAQVELCGVEWPRYTECGYKGPKTLTSGKCSPASPSVWPPRPPSIFAADVVSLLKEQPLHSFMWLTSEIYKRRKIYVCAYISFHIHIRILPILPAWPVVFRNQI